MKGHRVLSGPAGLVGRAWKPRGWHKYGARTAEYQGQRVDSKAEAELWRSLDLRLHAGAIRGYERQVPFVLQDGPRAVKITVIVDFVVSNLDGSVEILECKGVVTPVWSLKLRLLRVKYPHITIRVVSPRGDEKRYPAWASEAGKPGRQRRRRATNATDQDAGSEERAAP